MADEQITILVRLRNLAGKQIGAIQKGMKGLQKSVYSVGKAFTSLQAKVAGLGLTLSAGLITRSVINTFKEYDDTLRAAGAVTGATAEEFKTLGQVAEKMGKTTKFSAAQAADGLRLLGMAGFSVIEATEALPGVLQLAAAGALELGQAADIATNVLAGFGLEVEDLSAVNDVLAKTFTSSNSTLVELGEAFKLVGPIAAGVGSDFEDLVGSLGKLHDAGLKGTLAGTALRGAIDALLNPTKEEAKLMKELEQRMGGVALRVRDNEGNFIGFVEIIRQLEAAGLKGDEALKLFGLRAGPGMAALLSVGSKELDKYVDDLKDAGGTAKQIAEDMEAGIGGASRRTAAAMEGVKIALGRAFEEELIQGFDYITEKISAFIEEIDRLDREGTLEEWGKVAKESIQVVMKFLGKLIEEVMIVGRAMGTVALAIEGLFTGNFTAAGESLRGVSKAFHEFAGLPWKESGDDVIEVFHKIDEQGNVVSKNIINRSKQEREALEKDISALDRALESMRNKTEGKTGPIGRRPTKTTVTAEIKPEITDVTQLKTEAMKIKSIIERELVELDAAYAGGLVTLEDYFKERERKIIEAAESEIKVLQISADRETDINKRALMDARIFTMRQELKQNLFELEQEALAERDKLRQEEVELEKKAALAKEIIARQFNNVKARLASMEGAGLETQFAKEIADLQERQDREIAMLEEHNAKKEQINELYRQHELEKQKVAEDQARRELQYRLTTASEVAGGLANIMEEMYDLSGKKSKEMFYLVKAAKIAEATINVANAVTGALGAPPYSTGAIVNASIIGAMGAVQIAKIAATNLAEGGEVPGHSPHKKADNIPAHLTAGEWVQPVDTVRYYGTGIMEALRKRLIPRELFSGFSMPSVPRSTRVARFAEGGAVAGPQMVTPEAGAKEEKIDIVNVIDQSVFDRYLSSTPGKKTVFNVIRGNAYELKNILATEV